MRVTKLIKEYVEQEVDKKYYEATKSIGEEYHKQHELFVKEIEQLRAETRDRAYAIASKYGFTYPPGYNSIVSISTAAYNNEILEKDKAARSAIRNKRDETVKEIIFDFEFGETTKKELKDILEKVNF